MIGGLTTRIVMLKIVINAERVVYQTTSPFREKTILGRCEALNELIDKALSNQQTDNVPITPLSSPGTFMQLSIKVIAINFIPDHKASYVDTK
jgi:hypothetical protein